MHLNLNNLSLLFDIDGLVNKTSIK